MTGQSKVTLSSEPSKDGFLFRMSRSRIFGSAQALPVADWATSAADAQLPGVAQLLAWADEDKAAIADDFSMIVHHATVAALDAPSAQVLALPPSTPYLLDIQHVGTMDREDFRFRISWLQPNGQPMPGLRRMGAALTAGKQTYRIPEPLYGIIEAITEFDRAVPGDMDGRFRAWARMSDLLPDESRRSIKVDGYLNSTRIAHAASFSLALHSGADGFTFDPVLFGPELTGRIAEGHEDMPREVEGLLPPMQQQQFAEKRFPGSAECQARYALGGGWYVVLDEPVKKALDVVRKAQASTPEIRRAFVRNPRSFLAESLGDEMPDEVLGSVFVETAEFSDRVRDVGIWQAKVLPWVKKSGETWFPEQFGIMVGGKTMPLEARDVPSLREAVEAAIAQGKPTVVWLGQDIPASGETLAALNALTGEIKPPHPIDPSGETDPDGGADGARRGDDRGASDQYVLEIEGNLSEVGFRKVRIARPSVPALDLPVRLKTPLKPHQIEGVTWLQSSWAAGFPGVLLADDMGLGKTLQALAFMAWIREGMDSGTVKPGPILVVAPTGLLKNWEQEHDSHLHAPGLGDAVRAFGPGLSALRQRKGRDVDLGQAMLNSDALAHADWILTTYETLRDYQHSFCSIRYAAVVLDEMQKVKTPGTMKTDAVQALNADFLVGMTGTPIENRLADLWCLVETVQPGLLDSLSAFSKKYEKDENPDELRALKVTLTEPSPDGPQLMMRRMKVDRLKGLPEKIEHPLEQMMSDIQAQAYDEAVQLARSEGGGSKVLEALHRLRSISLHPSHPATAVDDRYADDSARFKLALEVLDAIAVKGEKALVFLESREMQPYFASLLQRRYKLRELPMLINGTVAGPKRQERVNQFQNGGPGFDVIILSPRAGGVGITLTAANHVIHLSRWWNPAVEDQCTDRVYRIGQTREVHVYYPQALHPSYADQSFDRRLHALLDRKRKLSREMLMPPMSPDDAKDLFNQTISSGNAVEFDPAFTDAMEPIQFEDWVLRRLSDVGHKVSRTPKSHDHGADGIAYHRISGRPYIIQCKHTQSTTPPDGAIQDLIRAKASYDLRDPVLVAVTNANGFGRFAAEAARNSGIVLVSRSGLERWPFSLD